MAILKERPIGSWCCCCTLVSHYTANIRPNIKPYCKYQTKSHTVQCSVALVWLSIAIRLHWVRLDHISCALRLAALHSISLIVSSDRSSCTDDGLLYIQSSNPLFQIWSIYAFRYCYKCHSKSLKQYQCN